MELNRELSQLNWLEVKHFVLDDSFECQITYLLLSFFTSMSEASLLLGCFSTKARF